MKNFQKYLVVISDRSLFSSNTEKVRLKRVLLFVVD